MSITKPWLWLSPQLAHSLAPVGLQLLASFREPRVFDWNPLLWRGLRFRNRLGLAGGVDKNGDCVEAWWTFGPGFIEVGTVTPRAQGPNPGLIFGRDLETKALWNRMGFPGQGVHSVRENLRELKRPYLTPIFVNIGKNRATPLTEAARDYVECIRVLGDLADAFVINISSPNTAGLRDLFRPDYFQPFLREIFSSRDRFAPGIPLLLKLSPDLESEDLKNVVAQSLAVGSGIDGWIATNTTAQREPGSPFPPEGGVSGGPLAKRSKQMLEKLILAVGSERKDRLIISTGGVMTAEDVMERLQISSGSNSASNCGSTSGADLVQVYSALIFAGPNFFAHVARELPPV